MKKLYIRTFGCQMNEYDSDKMADVLGAHEELVKTDNPEEADVILFNTCSVREKAQERVFHDLGRVRLLKQAKPGLIIDQYGITDNSNATSVGLIEWVDIEAIETIQVTSTRFLILHTTQPEKYLHRAKNGLLRATMQANYKRYGSPISITANTLSIKFSALENLVLEAFEKRKLS